jgi:hypothetical protein
MSCTRVDLPEPETPVTTVRVPRGISTSTLSDVVEGGAPKHEPRPRSSSAAAWARDSLGPDRKVPVTVSASRSRAGVPSKTSSPPFSPEPGPSSTTWSAARIAAGSCSTTITVLPRRGAGEAGGGGRRCRADEARWRARRARRPCPRGGTRARWPARCAAPRPREGPGGPVEVQVPQPHVDQEAHPGPELPQDRGGDLGLGPSSARASSQGSSSSRGSSSRRRRSPATFTFSASGRTRAPPQVGQVMGSGTGAGTPGCTACSASSRASGGRG